MKVFLTAVALTLASFGVQASAPAKPAPKIDCTQKKNATKLECKAPPKSDVKPEIKKPPKVERKAPASVQKKAAEENKKQ